MKNIEVEVNQETMDLIEKVMDRYPGMTKEELLKKLIRIGLREAGYDVPDPEEIQQAE